MAEKKLTIEKSTADFKKAYQAKTKLVEREHEDFLFALGEQWSAEDVETLKKVNMKPITDNRIQPNIFLLTGLERQNRSEFRAFPEGQEDGLKAEIASALFKHAIKTSDFSYKSSEQFKDGITCGESHIELYLDNTENILNGKPCWKKTDGNMIFPEPGFREYDYSDARYVYKLTTGLSKDDLIALYPDKERVIEKSEGGKVELSSLIGGTAHVQPRDYPKSGEGKQTDEEDKGTFDLLERYYKKFAVRYFVGDKKTGEIKEADNKEKAETFVDDYRGSVLKEQENFQMAVQGHQMLVMNGADPMQTPPPEPPEQKDTERFIIIKRNVPEMWVYAHVPGISEPLADERAWYYPKWKGYPFIPYFARFSTAPLKGDERHLLIQGIVHGVKGVQEKHNKAEMLMLRHLNTAANSGWLAHKDSWVDRKKVEEFGSSPAVNLEWQGEKEPERIFPMQLSQGHAQISADSVEAIKGGLGINADMLAAQEGGTDSGRAIALRQRQGLLMVQELFDNLARSRVIAGKLLLSQLGEMYDTETAKKVLGDAFLEKNFPPLMIQEPVNGTDGMPTGQMNEVPMKDELGNPMKYDKEFAEIEIAEVLSGDLGLYDVAVGEAVSSETMKLANSAEVKEFATAYPGLIPPDILIEESQLPQSTKNKILNSIKNAQVAQIPPAA